MDGARWKPLFVVVVFLLPLSNIAQLDVLGINETDESVELVDSPTSDRQKEELEKPLVSETTEDYEPTTFLQTIQEPLEDEATSIAPEEAITTSSVLPVTAPAEKQTPQPPPSTSTSPGREPPNHPETTTSKPFSPPHSPTTPAPSHPPPSSASPPSKVIEE